MLKLNKSLLSVNETKDFLGCGRDAVYSLLKDGSIDSTKIGHRRKIFADSVERYVANLPRGYEQVSDGDPLQTNPNQS